MGYLYFLDLSSNSLSGEIPSNWQGLKDLTFLDLSNNTFIGGIPGSICSLPSLRWLKLNNNNLSGELSESLQNCSRSLRVLDLGENKFVGTVPITNGLLNVSYLGLRANRLTGNIPEQLCQLSKLQILDLAQNNLSGQIPKCLGNTEGFKKEGFFIERFQYIWIVDFSEHVEIVVKGRRNEYKSILFLLKVIDLSGNSLMGEIPEEISNLSALKSLSLSWNQLTGKIPENIGSLQQLETLDLSSNHLSGSIPPSMSSMTFLSLLNLSGHIPSGNQFNTWNDPSIYEGNLYLCGAPLTTNCSVQDRNEEVEDEDGSERFWFYVSMALGFIAGFWAVCGTLMIKTSWRHAYFRFVEKMKDKLFVIIVVHVGRLYTK